jgi:anti-sigma regulatory factor (Ser/Thr protein kinase)
VGIPQLDPFPFADATHPTPANRMSEPPPRLLLSLPAVRESLPLIRHVVATLVETQPLSARRQEDVLLALTIAVADAVRHAQPAGTQLVIEAHVRARRLVITVTEKGPGVAPLVGAGEVPGSLAVMGSIADRLELGPANATRMSFCLSAPAAG